MKKQKHLLSPKTSTYTVIKRNQEQNYVLSLKMNNIKSQRMNIQERLEGPRTSRGRFYSPHKILYDGSSLTKLDFETANPSWNQYQKFIFP